MNGPSRRPIWLKLDAFKSKKSAGEGSDLRKIHLQAKWRVMKNPDYSKNTYLSYFSGGRGYKIDATM